MTRNITKSRVQTQNLPVLIGVPMDVGAGSRGMCFGPEALRIAGLARELGELGYHVTDLGDLDGPRNPEGEARNGFRHLDEVAAWCSIVRDKTETVLAAGQMPVVLGGDHSLSIGSVAGIARHCAKTNTPLSVLWIDAHADFNTPGSSPSGNIHGMPVAAICGALDDPRLNLGPGGRRIADPADVYLLGIRSVDPEEKRVARESGINIYDMRQIDEHGMVAIVREILTKVSARGGHLHVSFDLDFLDPDVAPGVGTPVRGGATWREAHLIMEMIHESGLAGSLDLVELNPYLDIRGTSAELMVDLAASLFGKQIMQRNPISETGNPKLEISR